MGQCCAKCCGCCDDGENEQQWSEASSSRKTREDNDAEDSDRNISRDDSMERRRDDEDMEDADMEYRRDDHMEDRRDEYTENDPLLPKVRPPAHRYLLEPTAPPLYADESHEHHDDINERTTEVPSEYEHGDLYDVDKHARRDQRAVIQLEPPCPAQCEIYHREHAAPCYSGEYNLHQDVQERELHYPIQEESPTPVIEPVLSHSYGTLLDEPGAQGHVSETDLELLTPPVNVHTPPLHNSPGSMVYSKGIESDTTSDLHEMSSLLRRLEVKSNIASGSCDHNGGILTSKDGDLELTIPKGAIKKGDLVEFCISTYLYRPFVLPSHCLTNLASPFYWIGVTGSYRFQKPVQVEFEHFAVVTACDPSHYQLLTCEDDDVSHIMRPVDCELRFDNESRCTFYTDRFCSYCLYHKCKDPCMISRIGAFFLKPKNFKILDQFTVEIWFSFPISHCLKRNEELYTSKGMILDSDGSSIFEASCDKSSTSYFALTYVKKHDGWDMIHLRFSEIRTKEVNFYSFYTNATELKAHENISLFPPRFVINVTKKLECKVGLNTDIIITCNTEEMVNEVNFKLYVPASAMLTNICPSVPNNKRLLSLVYHDCDKNKPVLRDLAKFSTKISTCWKKVALQLNISKPKVDTIEMNHPNRVEDMCCEMLGFWLQTETSPCWCNFAGALSTVGLNDVAEEAKTYLAEKAKAYLQNSYSDNTSTKVTAALNVCESSLKDMENTPNLYQLERYLKDIPESDLNFFVLNLFPCKNSALDVIRTIRRSGGSKVEKLSSIGKVFLKEKDPSWTKVYRALKEVETTECDSLAETIEACCLPV